MKVFFKTTQRRKINYNQNIKAIFEAIKDLDHKHINDYLMRIDIEGLYRFKEKKVR